jgi:hypothetical protein
VVRLGTLVSVPSWNAYYQSLIARDPVPLLTLFNQYGLEISYQLFCKFFKRKYIRTACAFKEYRFSDIRSGLLAVEAIPANVIGHAVRALEVREIRKRTICIPLETNDKFLDRLNYCITIQSMFKSSKFNAKRKPVTRKFSESYGTKFDKKAMKKLGLTEAEVSFDTHPQLYKPIMSGEFLREVSKDIPVWDIAHKVIANTFYLNYLFNYRNQKRLYQKSFSMIRGDSGTSVLLRSYCMSQKAKWLDDRLLNPVQQDKVVQTQWERNSLNSNK